MTKITKPGVYDLDEATYHGDPCPKPSLSAGTAETILAASPMHAAEKHPRLGVPGLPAAEDDHDPKFDLGCAFHAVMTGKGGRLVRVEAKDWKTNAAKEARAAAAANGDTALLSEQADRVILMCQVVDRQLRADPEIGRNPFVDRANNELAMFWKEGPIWCRAKPDAIDYDHRIIWDLKSTAGLADPDAWTDTQIRATGIDLRAAHYLRGAAKLLGPGWRYVFAVAEASRPHAASVVELTAAHIAVGEDKRARATAAFAECLSEGRWPGWPAGFNRPEPRAYQEARWLERRERTSSEALAASYAAQAPN